MNCIRRSCQSASQIALRHQQMRNGTRRAFSLSPRLDRRRLPSFHEPSTPELATLLSTLQSRVLLPQHLSKEQQKLVYKLENKPKLEAEPIEITVGDVTLPLEHLDRTKDLPDRWSHVKEILDKSETETDFENVLRMLEGCRDANVRLKPANKEKIVRGMTRKDMQHLVLKAVQRSDRTSMRLRKESFIITVMRSMHLKAFKSGWAEADTKKGLSYAEQVVALMEEKDNLGKVDLTPADPRSSPWVIAPVAELAAVRAKKHTGGKDLDGKVQKYAARLMNSLLQTEFATSGLPEHVALLSGPGPNQDSSITTPHTRIKAIHKITVAFRHTIPLCNALKVSLDVLGNDMPHHDDARRILGELQNALQKASENSKQWANKNDVREGGLGPSTREMEGL
ncbi:hypothetical protein BDV96DRAFT_648100 [Lophiotrema nucula]|uniref:Uncharacterized protein n=1 Tax=Lophiotrema nucula TaxID=690887 RepID=A0A6A5Z364_9PLEO|nr:hypothetical protein BDV96DRAFT_648100 [Lophiotrema nucula]